MNYFDKIDPLTSAYYAYTLVKNAHFESCQIFSTNVHIRSFQLSDEYVLLYENRLCRFIHKILKTGNFCRVTLQFLILDLINVATLVIPKLANEWSSILRTLPFHLTSIL